MTRPLSNDLRERVVAAVRQRRELPLGGVAVRRCGVLGGEVVAALSCDRLGCARQDGRASQAGAGAASRLHRGADQPDAASDAARAEGRTGGARGAVSRTMRCGCSCGARGCGSKKTLFALEQARADVARRRQRWRVVAEPASIRDAWSSSTRPGSRPTWLRCAAGGRRASACAASPRTATGAR